MGTDSRRASVLNGALRSRFFGFHDLASLVSDCSVLPRRLPFVSPAGGYVSSDIENARQQQWCLRQ
jgi:hypothetical protein